MCFRLYTGRRFSAGRWAALAWLGTMVFAGIHSPANAVIANPTPVNLAQPDGTPITLRIHGDEWFNWREDLNGFTVVADQGWYKYATLDANGQLAPTALVVGKSDPQAAGLNPNVLPTKAVLGQGRAQRLSAAAPAGGAPQPTPAKGTVRNLVILCMFNNHQAGVHTRPQADYNVLFNVGGNPGITPTGSVRDFYTENSFGALDLQSTVLAWVTLPQSEAYYANGANGMGVYPQNAQRMVEDALNLVNAAVDFGQFDADNDGYIDAIDIIHSGYDAAAGGGGGNWIWSHKWSLWALPGGAWSSGDRNAIGQVVQVFDYHTEAALSGTSGNAITRFAVICHETGHFFGLPDLYDTDYSGEGAGSWSMMANSWGFDFTELHPPYFDAWCKASLGWITPTLLTQSGTYSADQAETWPAAFRIDTNYPSGECLLIENRQPTGFETDMPQGGLIIYHVDEAKAPQGNTDEGYPGQPGWPQNGRHYRVAVLQGDGNYDLEHGRNRGDGGDPYHALGATVLSHASVPSSDAYQNGIVYDSDNTITGVGPANALMDFTYTTSSGGGTLYGLNVRATGRGRIRVNGVLRNLPWQGLFSPNQDVTLDATPDPGWFFQNWAGDVGGTVNPKIVRMDTNKSVVANFVDRPIALLSLLGAGGGRVKVNDQVVDLPWQAQFTAFQTVRLEAVPDHNQSFVNWSVDLAGSRNPSFLYLDVDKTVLATFSDTAPVSLALSKSGNGKARLNGSTIDLPWSGLFPAGALATLEAEPGAGWYFYNWTGDLSGSQAPATLIMDGPKSVGLKFVDTPSFTLALLKTGSGKIKVNGQIQDLPWRGGFRYGEAATLEAVADPGWSFLNWATDLRGGVNPVTVFMDGDKVVTATFGDQPPVELLLDRTGNGQAKVNGLGVDLPWTGVFPPGDQVTLEPATATGWYFARWTRALSGNVTPQTIVLDRSTSVCLNFLDTPPVVLTLNKDTANPDQVKVNGDIVTLPWTGGFRLSETVRLEPINVPGPPSSCFMYWLGDHLGNENPLDLAMDGDKSLTAVFRPWDRRILTVANDGGPCDYTAIQEAIDNSKDGWEILVYSGNYDENVEFPGYWDGTKHTGFKNVHLRSGSRATPDQLDPDHTHINAGGWGPVIDFYGQEIESCIVEGFTIGGGDTDYGGGVDGNGARASIRNNVFVNNYASQGGAIAFLNGPIEGNTFRYNTSSVGGALYRCRGPMIQNNFFEENGASGWDGGAIYDATGVIRWNTFLNNYVVAHRTNTNDDAYGGAISRTTGAQTAILYNRFVGNAAEKDGGALYDCAGPIVGNYFESNWAGIHSSKEVFLWHEGTWGGNGGAIANCAGEIAQNEFYFNKASADLYSDQTANNHPNRDATCGRGGALYDCAGRVHHNRFGGNKAFYGWTDWQTDVTKRPPSNPYGGGGGAMHSCPGQIDHNYFYLNSADINGGALNACGSVIQNNLFVGNIAIGQEEWQNNRAQVFDASGGGGIYNCDGSVLNNTFFGNTAGYRWAAIDECDGAIQNCILWENGGGGTQMGRSSAPSYSDIQHWTGGGAGNIIANPQFADPDIDEPAMGDYHILPGSPCVDAGRAVAGLVDDLEISSTFPSVIGDDERPFDGTAANRGDGSDIDIGCDEYVQNPFTLRLDSSGTGTVQINGQTVSLPYQGYFRDKQVVTLSALPAKDCFFYNWVGDLYSALNPLTFTMSSDLDVTARFMTGQAFSTLILNGAGAGKVLVNDGELVSLPWQGHIWSRYPRVSLEAIPDPGNYFLNWSGDLYGNTNPTSVVVDHDTSITVHFSDTAPLNLYLAASAGAQATARVNGAPVRFPWSGAFLRGDVVGIQADPGPGWFFSGWSGSVKSIANPEFVIMDGNKGILADFVCPTPYKLSLLSYGNGSAAVNGTAVSLPWEGHFLDGQTVTIQPAPATGWFFVDWSGDLFGSAAPQTVVMNSDKTVWITYTATAPYALNLLKNGYGYARINGAAVSLPWSGKFRSDTPKTVALEGVPSYEGYYFSKWTGDLQDSFNPGFLAMDGNKTVTANFAHSQPLTLTILGSGEGKALVNGQLTNLPWQGSYWKGSIVTVQAVPDPGYYFLGWMGDLFGSYNPETVIMDVSKSVTAQFVQSVPLTLTFSGSGSGSGRVNGHPVALPWQGLFLGSDIVTLEAVPKAGWYFIEWQGALIGSVNPQALSMGGFSRSVVARFTDRGTVMLNLSQAGNGQVTVDGLARTLPFSKGCALGDAVQLQATPDPGWGFWGWSGGLTGNQDPATVIMDGDKDITVTFRTFGDLSNGSAFLGEAAQTNSGSSAACVGDVNGDGYEDLAIGAPGVGPAGTSPGKAYLVLGRPGGLPPVNELAAVADASFVGETSGDQAGASIAGAGDVNGDGYDDFLVGAPQNGASKTQAGKVYLLLGHPDPAAHWGQNFQLANPGDPGAGADATFLGEWSYDHAGSALGGALNGKGLDVNGDGLGDFLIGAPGNDEASGASGDSSNGAGKTYLLLGRAAASWGKNFALNHAAASFLGESTRDFSGCGAAGAGDVNGDGFDDFLIGAYNNCEAGGAPTEGSGAGKAYLLLGRSNPARDWGPSHSLRTATEGNPDQGADAFFLGASAGDNLGRAVAGVGDVDHDGYHDFVVGLPGAGSGAGQANLYRGRPMNWSPTVVTPPSLTCAGQAAGDQFGWSVASGVGNIDGDDNDDVLIGAPHAGKVYLNPPAGPTVTGQNPSDRFGACVAAAGDFNGDGVDDYLVGAPRNAQNGSGAGKTYLMYGMLAKSQASAVRRLPSGNPPVADFSTARCRIKPASGSTSIDTVTIQRGKAGIAGIPGVPSAAVAGVCWRLETTRTGFTSQMALHYTDAEINGLEENLLQLHQAPDPAGPWTPVSSQSLDAARNVIQGAISGPGYFALTGGLPQGAPILDSAADDGGGRLKFVWSQPAQIQPPFQVLAFAWDMYERQWANRGLGGTMWFPFPADAYMGSWSLVFTGGYHAWVSNQYPDGGWIPCQDPWTGVLYSGTPHVPSGLSGESRGGHKVRLHWSSDIFGVWLYQIACFQEGVGWISVAGPSGLSDWHFVDYSGTGYLPNTADFFNGWADFDLLSDGRYWLYMRGVGWDGTTAGEFGSVNVAFP